ncbi:PREDICTED: alpha-1,3-mannosyl-glycoprotein 2-beta-N-acetylglucosaminyltransferase-like [Cyprinodon variegatus]|uniref:alpha-1,3-mannosyl-glycoprotein 2-beta-N-acetylglucosaminyltransferase-like n=1 Tax=Cyprinodon variegatus TaxID=28743 RepID=UPI000742CCF9|nr:PREDICTED: alpha-1,3-mannosyl-glycoprotein 2-beta-N-acetylglucosaminyltransferase-like [Cyprinodon variegatus]
MVRKKGSLILCGAFLFVAWNALLLLYLWGRPPIGHLGDGGGAEPGGNEEWAAIRGKMGQGNLAEEMIRLAEEVEVHLDTQKKLLKQIESHRAVWARRKDVGKRESSQRDINEPAAHPQRQRTPEPLRKDAGEQTHTTRLDKMAPSLHGDNEQTSNTKVTTPSPEPIIPILVIACDRVTVKRSLDRLLMYRPSAELYPIIVSQDCGHAETARVIASYGEQVTHIKQPQLSDIKVRPEHRKFQGYYKIARHYRWALNQVFNTFSQSTVVIVEDDLEVSSSRKSTCLLGLQLNII